MESANPCVDEGCAGYGLWKLARSLYIPCRRILYLCSCYSKLLAWGNRDNESAQLREMYVIGEASISHATTYVISFVDSINQYEVP